jgi:signal transduction histidine kinase
MASIILLCAVLLTQTKGWAQSAFDSYKNADSLFMSGQYELSLPILQSLLGRDITDSIRAEVFLREGIICLNKNINDSALYYSFKSVDIFKLQNNKNKLARAYKNIGIAHFKSKNYRSALYYYQFALLVRPSEKDSLNIYFNICDLYQTKEDFSNSYDIIINHLLKFKKNIVPGQTQRLETNFGLYYNTIGMHDSALYHYKIALINAETDKAKFPLYTDICNEYRLMKKYNIALLYLDSANNINNKIGTQRDSLAVYDSFREIYSETGDSKKALKYAQLARSLSDSIYNTEQAAALQDAETKYQTAKKDADNKILAKDNSIQQRNLTFSLIGLGLVAILGALSFRSYKQKQQANKKLQVLAAELDASNQTKARLFSTIGHDLRSPISSLYALLKMQEVKGGASQTDAAAMSQHTIGLLDTLEDLLVWSKTQMDRFTPTPVRVPVHELYEELIGFFAITATEKNRKIINKCSASLACSCDENMLRTILRNAIGNAINHTKSVGPIVLDAREKENKLLCEIKNPCMVTDFEQLQAAFENAGVRSGSAGLGLVLIKEFAQKMQASISLAYEEGYAVVSVALPKK